MQGRGGEGVEGGERIVRADSCPKADSPTDSQGARGFSRGVSRVYRQREGVRARTTQL